MTPAAAAASPSAVAGVVQQGQELTSSLGLQLFGQVAGGDDLQQLEQLLEQQLSEMELLGKDPAAAAAAMQAPARRSADVAATNLGADAGAATAAAAAAAAWQAGYDGDVDTASESSGSELEDDVDDGSSSNGSQESVRYRPVEGAPGRPTSANRIERLVAMYRQQQLAHQQQRHAVDRSPETAPRGGVDHSEELGSDGAGSDVAGVSEMLSMTSSRFLQE
jgi:hypothetical protein